MRTRTLKSMNEMSNLPQDTGPLTKALTADLTSGSSLSAPFRAALYSEAIDAVANISTSYTISVGDQFDGTISSSSDADWVRVNLTAGETYVFTVWGTGGSAAGLDDTLLRLYGSSGNLLLTNDDVDPSVGNHFSLIEFTATTTGTYYLGVSAYGGETGTYRLQAATNVYTVEQVVTQLIDFGWGIPTPIAHDERTGDTMTVNIAALTAAGQQLALWALEAWSVATGMTFSTTTSTSADILFDDNQAGAFAGPEAYFPNTGQIVQASVNISTNWLSTYGTSIGSYSFLTYLHEIGHALGLVHAGNYNGAGNYATNAVFLNDSYQMTVMSYFDQIDNTFINADFAFPITPMIADIAAVAELYGATISAYAGNTIWGANSNIGGYLGTIFGYLFDDNTINTSIYNNGPVAFTIQDSSGTDTLDLSTTTSNNNVNLVSGSVLDVAGMVGNVVIAQGTIIENYVGGSGNEQVSGNSANNQLNGNGGFDTLDGGAGNDTLDGGGLADSLLGGADDDTLFGR
ncbi:M10 family metallopeptidase C-terminal domain-containing protein, partial [Defluviimonas sp. WL0050]